jgi:sulfotransferase family protein
MQRFEPADIHFLGIGAEKSGTTWLFEMLHRHPQVYMPQEKELYYFNRYYWHRPNVQNYRFDKPVSWYLSFFDRAPAESVKGEVCPAYICDDQAAAKIFSFNPNIRLIALLRDPVERAFSQYLYYIQLGEYGSRQTFEESLKKDPQILRRGLYAQQLMGYYSLFPRENILVGLLDDIKKDSSDFLIRIERFLGVEEYIPESIDESINITGAPKYPFINRAYAAGKYLTRKYSMVGLLNVLNRTGVARSFESLRSKNMRPLTVKQTPDMNTVKMLKDYFRSDIEQLEELIQRDLDAWK